MVHEQLLELGFKQCIAVPYLYMAKLRNGRFSFCCEWNEDETKLYILDMDRVGIVFITHVYKRRRSVFNHIKRCLEIIKQQLAKIMLGGYDEAEVIQPPF